MDTKYLSERPRSRSDIFYKKKIQFLNLCHPNHQPSSTLINFYKPL